MIDLDIKKTIFFLKSNEGNEVADEQSSCKEFFNYEYLDLPYACLLPTFKN